MSAGPLPDDMEEVRLVQDLRNTLGEGPVWDDRKQALYWIDIEGKKLFRYKEEGSLKTWTLPKRPGSFALRDKGGLLVAFEDGFALYEAWDEEAESGTLPSPVYVEGPYQQQGKVRLNDGRCDRQGRFIAGGYNGDEGDASREWAKACGVYIVSPPASCCGSHRYTQLLPNLVRCTNSIAFSPDGSTMYFTDSPSREIVAYDYDQASGSVKGPPRVFATIPEPGVPDGSIVDSQGYVWNAEFFSGRLVRYAPDGSVDRVVQVPATKTTCAALGGSDLKTLYVTSASIECPESEKGAGGLWAIRVDTPGIPEPRYQG